MRRHAKRLDQGVKMLLYLFYRSAAEEAIHFCVGRRETKQTILNEILLERKGMVLNPEK